MQEENGRTWLDAKLCGIEDSIRRVEATVERLHTANNEQHQAIGSRVERLEARGAADAVTFRVLRWVALAGLAIVAAIKSGSLEPLKHLFVPP